MVSVRPSCQLQLRPRDTREEGHGFGLHSSALAAQELGGSLRVHSDDPGHGASFTLELPYTPVQETTQV